MHGRGFAKAGGVPHVLEQDPGHATVLLERGLQQPEHMAHQARALRAPSMCSVCGALSIEHRVTVAQQSSSGSQTLPSRPERAPARLTSTQGKPAVTSSVSCVAEQEQALLAGELSRMQEEQLQCRAAHLGQRGQRANVGRQQGAREHALEHLHGARVASARSLNRI
jgi:hypothetical protein